MAAKAGSCCIVGSAMPAPSPFMLNALAMLRPFILKEIAFIQAAAAAAAAAELDREKS